jgi:hypothetical protein
MSKEQSAWLLLLFLGIFLIIIGVQGNLGKFVAILFVPRYIAIS